MEVVTVVVVVMVFGAWLRRGGGGVAAAAFSMQPGGGGFSHVTSHTPGIHVTCFLLFHISNLVCCAALFTRLFQCCYYIC